MKSARHCSAVLALLATTSAHGVLFSIDAMSPSTALVSPADILAPGPLGGPPAVAIPFGALGLLPGDDVNAIAYAATHADPLPPMFSVDRFAVGAPGLPAPSVTTEKLAGQAAGDIFIAPAPFTNTLVVNQSALGLLPAVAAGIPAPPPPGPFFTIDNLDALEMLHPVTPTPAGLFYTLKPGSPTLAAIPGGATGGDILTTGPGGPGIAIPFAALGLVAGDEIDALLMLAGAGAPPPVVFSLAPGSPSLVGVPATPGDLLIPGPAVFVTAAMLGLLPPPDNLDAVSAVPEAHTYVLLLTGLVTVCGCALRRPRCVG